MIVATRLLTLSAEAKTIDVPVRLFMPERAEHDWSCKFEIDWPVGKNWPNGTQSRIAWGVDSMQALLLALQMLGNEIYASDYHASRELRWGESWKGYGFPVASNTRDLLIGDDKEYF
jgi:hypothetical protein